MILTIVLVCYVLIPLFGAWRTRSDWAVFREAAIRAMQSPEADFSLLQSASSSDLRLTGTLEAFEGRDRLWIGGERVSAAVSLRGAPVYFLDEEPPRRMEAASLGALPEGTRFLVAGPVTGTPGHAYFAARPGQGLLVLSFDGDPTTALERAVSSGRPRFDVWNPWTLFALGAGFALLLILAYVDLRPGGNTLQGLAALSLALLPSTLFLPPGVIGLLIFTRLWAQSRSRRSSADVGRLIQNELPPKGARWREIAAYVCLLAGAAANAGIAMALLALWIPSAASG